MRPRLSFLMNNIYIPKYKAKCFANFLYSAESHENINDYNVV